MKKKLLSLLLAASAVLSVFTMFPGSVFAATEYNSGNYYYTVNGSQAIITDVKDSISGNITIPSTLGGRSVTEIDYRAFYDQDGIKSVTIPNSIRTIGEDAFYDCDGITYVKIGTGVTTIPSDCFNDCDSITSVDIGSNVTEIGDYAFADCGSLSYINWGSRLKTIGYAAFASCTSLSSLTIPNTVTTLEGSAFNGCDGITSVNIGSNVTSIGSYAFEDCTGITTLSLGSRVKEIGYRAFYECTGLRSLTIPNSVTSIDEDAFYDCDRLTTVSIGTGLTKIPSDCFNGCDSLKTVNLGANVVSIGSYAFSDCGSLSNINWGSSLKTIEYAAFSGCSSISSLTIPNTVTTIEGSAFNGCNGITSVNIGSMVTSIDSYAFEDCTGMTTVNLGSKVTDIGYRAFYNCESLKKVWIPASLQNIEDDVFYNCPRITDVYYASSEYDWNYIYIGDDNSDLTSARIHYNAVPPTSPSGFKITGSGNKGKLLVLDWNDSNHAGGYRVYIVSDGKEYYKATVRDSEYKFTDLNAGWNYTVKVQAFNSYGTADSTTSICAAPSPIWASEVDAKASGNKLIVKWEKRTCTGYVVQWSKDRNFSSVAGTKYVTGASNTSCTANVSNPQNYYVRVRAYKTYYGKTSYGDFCPAVKPILVPGTITGFDIIGTGNKGKLLYLDWTGMAHTYGYRIYIVSGNKEYYQGSTRDSQFKFTDLTPGWNYNIMVVAYNQNGSTATKTSICSAPSPMYAGNIDTSVSGKNIRVNWNKQTCTGYVVQWSMDKSFSRIAGTKYINGAWNTGYTITANNARKYYVRVRAYKTYNGMTAYGDFSPAVKVS